MEITYAVVPSMAFQVPYQLGQKDVDVVSRTKRKKGMYPTSH
jgi:hypothetical protein